MIVRGVIFYKKMHRRNYVIGFCQKAIFLQLVPLSDEDLLNIIKQYANQKNKKLNSPEDKKLLNTLKIIYYEINVSKIAILYAMGLVNLLCNYPDESKDCIDELKDLVNKYPNKKA